MHDRLPGGLAAGEFLRRYWQKKPLLVRGAMRDLGRWPGKRGLFALAQRSDVESRLVARIAGRWTVRHGPIPRAILARQPRRDWTLLVNGVNLHCAAAERLLRRFAFVPQARLDDVMVSFAAPGGGVGAHADGYDVFLLQGAGRRVWRLEPARRFATVPGAPLRLIADFRPQEELLLEPGDLLYLPPGWGHEGVALDESWTYSIGFRAPRRAELAAAFLDYLHERGFDEREYRDPGLRPATRPARIDAAMLRFAGDAMRRIRWSRRDVESFLGRYLTSPKQHVVFRAPRHARSRRAFLSGLARGIAVLDARTQLLYLGARFFLNGEALSPRASQRDLLARLADRRRLRGRALARAGLGDLLYDWYRDGSLNLESET